MPDPHGMRAGPEMPGFEDWRALVERSLGGRDLASLNFRTRDGVVIEPLYLPRTDAAPISPREAHRWAILQPADDPDPERASLQARADLAGGADGLVLVFAEEGCPGLPASPEALRIALEEIDLARVRLRVSPHPRAAAIAGWLREIVARQGLAPERARIAWGLDPIACGFAETGEDPAVALAAAYRAVRDAGFAGPVAEIDARPIHEAGGSEAQELAGFLAGAAWWLRALDAAGIAAGEAFPGLGLSLAVDREQFLSIAKLRAARLLWARLAELCGVAPIRLPIHAATGRRMMTWSDPHTNLIRMAVAASAAGVGGADSLAILPHRVALGPTDAGARATARNLQHLLLDEAHLGACADPAAGSGLFEALTGELCAAAWEEFRRIEAEGGILDSLRTGGSAERVGHAREALRAELAGGQAPLVGATAFRDGEAASGAPALFSAGPRRGPLIPVSLEELAAALG